MPVPTTPSEAIATKLLATAGVTSLVGRDATSGVYSIFPDKPTQDAPWDYVVFYKTGGGDGLRLDGRNKLQNYTFRFDVYAQTQGRAEALIKAITVAFDGWVDVANKVKGCFPVGDEDEQVFDDGTQISGKSFSLWYLVG